MKKVTKLTDAQRARFPECVEKWTKIGLSCEPADWALAESSVMRLYDGVNLERPKVVVRVSSPIVGAFAAAIAESMLRSGAVYGAVYGAVGGAVDGAVRGAVRGAVDGAVGDAVRGARIEWHYWLGGALWAAYPAWYDALADIAPACRVPIGDAYADLSRACGYVWPNRRFVMICDRPREILRDDRGRLHAEDRAAISWRDGYGIYSWHGVTVPAKVILAPETLTVAEIKAEKNAEVARVMRERFGQGRYLRETGAKLIDADFEGARKGAAPRALLEDHNGERWLVGTDGSTGREYHMSAPRTVKTCRDAHVARCGFDEKRILNKS